MVLTAEDLVVADAQARMRVAGLAVLRQRIDVVQHLCAGRRAAGRQALPDIVAAVAMFSSRLARRDGKRDKSRKHKHLTRPAAG